MMLSTGIPELKSAEDIYYLRDALCLGMPEEAAAQEFRNLIHESLRMGWSTQLNWAIHNFVHSK
jgi:phosphatidylinositol-4,5-bisphosphate 3-kinase